MNPPARFKISLAFLAGIFLVGSVLVAVRGEASYRGVPLVRWMEDMDSSSLETQRQAADAIRHIGSPALGTIGSMLRHDRVPWSLIVQGWLARQTLIPVRPPVFYNYRRLSVRAATALGPVARPLIPDLIGLLDHPQLARESAAAMSVIDPDIFPLTRTVTNAQVEPAVRRQIIRRLESGNYSADLVEKALRETSRDDNPEIQREALAALRAFLAHRGGNKT